MHAICRLGSECKLGYYIFSIFEIAIEGVVFGRDVNAVVAANTEPIILNMQAVDLHGMTMYTVIIAVVTALDNKALLAIVSNTRAAEAFKSAASWH
jgi:hypothetical protein